MKVRQLIDDVSGIVGWEPDPAKKLVIWLYALSCNCKCERQCASWLTIISDSRARSVVELRFSVPE
jgi:hypothetical protein